MKFQEFWRRLHAELQQTKEFRTMTYGKEFKARVENMSTIQVVPQSTKIPRPVKIIEFQAMWNMMKNDVRNERYISTNGRYAQFYNPVYVSALVDHIVGNQNME